MSNAGPGVRLRTKRLADWNAPAYRIHALELPRSPRATTCDDLKYRNRKTTVDHRGRRLTYGSLWAEAAALSYMAASPHDVRPHLLLAYFGQIRASTEAAITYGHRYLEVWCARVGIGQKWTPVFPFAAADALAVLYWGRATRIGMRVSITTRARQFNIAPRDYSLLREKALEAYRLRLTEAIVQFERALTRMEIYAPANLHTQSRNTGLPACGSEFLARRAA